MGEKEAGCGNCCPFFSLLLQSHITVNTDQPRTAAKDSEWSEVLRKCDHLPHCLLTPSCGCPHTLISAEASAGSTEKAFSCIPYSVRRDKPASYIFSVCKVRVLEKMSCLLPLAALGTWSPKDRLLITRSSQQRVHKAHGVTRHLGFLYAS